MRFPIAPTVGNFRRGGTRGGEGVGVFGVVGFFAEDLAGPAAATTCHAASNWTSSAWALCRTATGMPGTICSRRCLHFCWYSRSALNRATERLVPRTL